MRNILMSLISFVGRLELGRGPSENVPSKKSGSTKETSDEEWRWTPEEWLDKCALILRRGFVGFRLFIVMTDC